ncbi:uncharacterized protein LOC120444679 [Drosophila santomea]|uniref:uncharacterized protein LOC120444679 n=2 Tax=melanogaster subgroup TaxID=32351 RepID=UPI0019544096|nr:uncharacterized protein LOC120444679 [Drosophila santomea]
MPVFNGYLANKVMATWTEFFLLFGLWHILQVQGVAKFTNIECLGADENFTTISLCRLYAVKRDVAEMSLRARILQWPKGPVSMRMQLLKKASGYKPFLYNICQSDVCEYLEKRNHPFVNIILSSFGNRTNVNKCPIPSEIVLEHFRFPVKVLDIMPLPFGDYALFTTFSFRRAELAQVKVYFTLTEYR